MLTSRRTATTTPVPSSDVIGPSSSQENRQTSTVKVINNDISPLAAPAKMAQKSVANVNANLNSSPSRKVTKDPTNLIIIVFSYAYHR